MSGPLSPPDTSPHAGEVFIQFGVRLVVLEVTPDWMTYVCRTGSATSEVRSIPLSEFELNLSLGLIERWEPLPAWLETDP